MTDCYTIQADTKTGNTCWLINCRPIGLSGTYDAYWSYEAPNSPEECFQNETAMNNIMGQPGFISYAYCPAADIETARYYKVEFKTEFTPL